MSNIMFLDANNFDGWAMSQPLLVDEYKLMSNDDCCDAFKALHNKASRDWLYEKEMHYISEVDFDCQPELD